MIFGSVRFALFVKTLKTVRFLETENGTVLGYGAAVF
jgi:hypothetical protein